MRGRHKTTGRFNTRSELENEVWWLYKNTSCSDARIARNTGVSTTTVGNILKTKPKTYHG